MTNRKSIWTGKHYAEDGNVLAYDSKYYNDDIEWREVLPDDGWQPWSVAKHWNLEDNVLVWHKDSEKPRVSQVGVVRNWLYCEDYLYMKIKNPHKN